MYHTTKVDELPQNHCGDNQDGTLFSLLHIYYAHLAFVRFEHSVCCGSLMTCIYIHGGAEVCELVGYYMLNQLKHVVKKVSVISR